jgi:membrane protease YdiL (CAAX protease family)
VFVKNPLARAILFVALAAVAVLGYLFLLSVFAGQLGAFSRALPAFVLAAATLYLNRRFLKLESLSLRDIGIDSFLPRISQAAVGFLGGFLLVAMWALALRLIAGVSWRVSPQLDPVAALGAFTFIFFNNAGEELVYRGYLFLLLSRTWGAATAVITTCLLFTLLHIQSGVSVGSAIAGVLTTSLIFAALFLRWQSLPLVLGFHAATNVGQEFFGIRPGGLSYLTAQNLISISPRALNTVLVVTGLLNTAVAAAFFLNWKKRKVDD